MFAILEGDINPSGSIEPSSGYRARLAFNSGSYEVGVEHIPHEGQAKPNFYRKRRSSNTDHLSRSDERRRDRQGASSYHEASQARSAEIQYESVRERHSGLAGTKSSRYSDGDSRERDRGSGRSRDECPSIL